MLGCCFGRHVTPVVRGGTDNDKAAAAAASDGTEIRPAEGTGGGTAATTDAAVQQEERSRLAGDEGEQEEHLEDLNEAEEMSQEKKEKLHKDLIEAVVKRVHGASRAAGMSFSKPRQVIDDMAVLYAQAMELNEVCASKSEVAASIAL